MNDTIRSYYITTPIYYVNGAPHVGHASTTVLVDALARYHRLFGDDVLFVTGTDEHGQKAQDAARRENLEPGTYCDRVSARFAGLWKILGISHDDFIRTTEPRHSRVVRHALAELLRHGEIYKGEYAGRYCVSCERFVPSGATCPECGRPAGETAEPAYFFRLSGHRQWLIDHIATHPDFILPEIRRNETLGFLRQSLEDLCISRPKSRVAWGIELPFDSEFVCYVWFDALLNYATAAGYFSDGCRFAHRWPADCHVIAKEILTPHTVYWPAILHALGLEPPRTVLAHGWWLLEDRKIGKSLGNAVDPAGLVSRYGADALRWYLARELGIARDGQFSVTRLIERHNAELANIVGNCAGRVLKLLTTRCGGRIPELSASHVLDRELLAEACALAAVVRGHVGRYRVDLALDAIVGTATSCNRYLQKTAPWKADDRRAAEILRTAAEALRIVAGLLLPVVPAGASRILAALGCDPDSIVRRDLSRGDVLETGSTVEDPGAVFPRILQTG